MNTATSPPRPVPATDRLAEDAPPGANTHPREPERLRLPAGGVQYLLQVALRTEVGSAWWNGFRTAHGEPSWLAPGRWRLVGPDLFLLPADPAGEEA